MPGEQRHTTDSFAAPRAAVGGPLFAPRTFAGAIGLAVAGIAVTVYDVVTIIPAALFLCLVLVQWTMRWRIGALSLIAMVAVAATAPMNGVRILSFFTLSDLFAVVAALFVVASQVGSLEKRSWSYFRPPLFAAALITYGGLVGMLAGSGGWEGVGDLVRFALSTIGVLLLVSLWGPSPRDVTVVAWAFTIGASVNAFAGLIALHDASGRAIGLTLHSNHFALVSLLACGISVGLALASRAWPRRFAVLMSIILVAGMLESGSRATVVGALVMFATLLVMTRSWRLLRWAAVLGGSFALLLAVNVIELTSTDALGRLFNEDPTVRISDEERTLARGKAFRTIDSRPVTGVGFSAAKEAHNVYLQVWAAAGLLGLFGVSMLATSIVGMSWRAPRGSPLLLGYLASLCGYLAAAPFTTVFWDRYLWIHLAFAVALMTAHRRVRYSRPEPSQQVLTYAEGSRHGP